MPFFSIYCASKWAVEGFTEAINQEVKPEWGIKFTCIEPGGFRTDCKLGINFSYPKQSHGNFSLSGEKCLAISSELLKDNC